MIFRRTVVPVLSVLCCVTLSGCRNGDANQTQGWTEAERAGWYAGTQGSRLMPMTWFTALERSGSDKPFADPEWLLRYGFLERAGAKDDALPIGFAKDRQADTSLGITSMRWYQDQPGGDQDAEPWIGMNCSACHTGRITFQGEQVTVEGGPNLLDFQSFVEDLDAALAETRTDRTKWDRFAGAVLDGRDTPENRAMLETAYSELLDWQQRTAAMNATPLRYGFGRLDAVGHILNKILMFNGAPPSAGNPANAPVSYPFLWGIQRQEHVQWNGIAKNSRFQLPGDSFEYGAMGRNTGEVLGVFGDLVVISQLGPVDQLRGYVSSVRPENLEAMERLVGQLQPPQWPASFPAIDEDLRDQGAILFDAKCANCHLPPDRQEAGKPTERMSHFIDMPRNEMTDIWMACNAYTYRGPSGPMEGAKTADGKVIGAVEPVSNMLAAGVLGALLGKKGDLVEIGFQNFFGIRLPPTIDRAPDPFDPRAVDRSVCLTTPNVDVLGYKARPLEGIWATAPYLHNGSVASLYELLLPADQRTPKFWVGNREYDPVKVGYVATDPGDGRGFLLETVDANGRPIEGNSNHGHEYGAAAFTEQDRAALLEYLKSL